MEKKFLKVWTTSVKKGIVCSNLEQLIEKGSTKLNITTVNLKAYLEDGTELDDEEIFEALPVGTVVYLLNEDEKVCIVFIMILHYYFPFFMLDFLKNNLFVLQN